VNFTEILGPSVFETFNARGLDPSQVAKRFIPPRQFEELILRNHSIIVGPRGSGKTTLLKMLQVAALREWEHPSADRYRAKLDFSGIYVAADVSWGEQLAALGGGRLAPDTQAILGYSAFTTHILSAFLQTIQDVTNDALLTVPHLARLHVSFDRQKEKDFVNILARSWELKPHLPTILSLSSALRDRLVQIDKVANSIAGIGGGIDASILQESSFLFLGWLSSISQGVEEFNSAVGQPHRKWALLFDELEISPKKIRQEILAALRSTNQRLLFKLSMSPYNEEVSLLDAATAGMSGEDYKVMRLWYARKEQGFEFSTALVHSMLDELKCSLEDLGRAFFHSTGAWEDNEPSSLSGYRPGTHTHSRFQSLATRDPSFAAYLARSQIDLERMHLLGESERASTIRKVTSLVTVRETFRSTHSDAEGNPRANRSRKNPLLYTGIEALLSIVEGNPRWTIGLLGPLLRRYQQVNRGRQKTFPVPRHVQALAVKSASDRFQALLRSLPYVPPGSSARARNASSKGLLSLLDAIGTRLHRHVVVDNFVPQPVLSFFVPATAPIELVVALGRALNVGAIVAAPKSDVVADSDDETIHSGIAGRRFRLSHMLARAYGLPLILGREGNIVKLLEEDETKPLLFEGADEHAVS
jgi:energy-coupling factor transporter ATP-binding protein EcfA2